MSDKPDIKNKEASIEAELKALIQALSRKELFELGWDFHTALIGHVHDARDLRRSMMTNPTLNELGKLIDWMDTKNGQVAKIKMFINAALEEMDA